MYLLEIFSYLTADLFWVAHVVRDSDRVSVAATPEMFFIKKLIDH